MYTKIQPRSDNVNLNIKIRYVQAHDGRIIYSYESNSNCKLWKNLNIRPLVYHYHVQIHLTYEIVYIMISENISPNNRLISMSYRQLSQSHSFINYHIDKSRPVVFWIVASNNEKHYCSLFYACFIPKNGLYSTENEN